FFGGQRSRRPDEPRDRLFGRRGRRDRHGVDGRRLVLGFGVARAAGQRDEGGKNNGKEADDTSHPDTYYACCSNDGSSSGQSTTGFDRNATPVFSPAKTTSSTSAARASASSPGASRSDIFKMLRPRRPTVSMRIATVGSSVFGRSPASMHACSSERIWPFISRANAKRSYSLLILGTDRSRNISAKYCGCSRLNS